MKKAVILLLIVFLFLAVSCMREDPIDLVFNPNSGVANTDPPGGGALPGQDGPEILRVYTETVYANSTLFDFNPSLLVCIGNIAYSISSETGLVAEGAEAIRCNLVTSSGGYWGMGIPSYKPSKNEDLSRFAGGYLKCLMMAPSGFSQNVRIGIQAGTEHPDVQDFLVNPFSYGLVADGNWYTIAVPIYDLGITNAGQYCLTNVSLAWMVNYTANPTANTYIYFDDVHWQVATNAK